MKKETKKSNIKKIFVECYNWVDSVEIDSDVFDDIYMEAATRSIENRYKGITLDPISAIIKCWKEDDEKNIDKQLAYNTYFVLINAGFHMKAEMLRLNFLKLHSIDLKKEVLKDYNNGSTNNTVTNN